MEVKFKVCSHTALLGNGISKIVFDQTAFLDIWAGTFWAYCGLER